MNEWLEIDLRLTWILKRKYDNVKKDIEHNIKRELINSFNYFCVRAPRNNNFDEGTFSSLLNISVKLKFNK